MNDLNELVVGDSSLYLLLAQGINDQGEIVGTAVEPDGTQVGFLAVPAYSASAELEASRASRLSSHAFAGSNIRPQLSGFARLLLERAQVK